MGGGGGGSGGGSGGGGLFFRLPYRYAKALMSLVLLTYAVVLETTLSLLHCVTVAGGGVEHPLRLYLAVSQSASQ